MPKTRKEKAEIVKEKAKKLGLDFCGISKAEFLSDEAKQLETWLSKGMHGKMQYMENHFDLRLDPTKLVPGAKSVISLMLNYFPQKKLEKKGNYKISKYAYGEDYHYVFKRKLKELITELREEFGEIGGRAFVDSAPVMERTWAQKSGLGWIGKNSLLINKKQGSFFFLGELITDLDLEPDGAIKDYCGTCTKCIDACPTDAIAQPYVIDSNKCISYLTIELKEEIPQEFNRKMENWIFGCDICQDVCPWNRFSKPHKNDEFHPSRELEEQIKQNWEEITEEIFKKVFKKSAVKRTKYKGFTRNIQFIKRKQ